jgi:predicted small lipoprotein YifL
MRHVRSSLVVAIALAALAACGKSKELPKAAPSASADAAMPATAASEKPPTPAEAPSAAPPAPLADPKALAEEFGVPPGGLERSKLEGPEAVLTAADGAVLVRKVGEEDFAPAKASASLFAGDQIKTETGATATVTFLDDSTAQLAGDSAIAIGSRDVTADPASAAAVLHGVARFGVSARAPGEGPFLVFAPGAVVGAGARADVVAVGVAADGSARVAVETGEVVLSGLKQLDKPVNLAAQKSIDVSAAGELAAAADWKSDDWAAWRGKLEADGDAKALASAHLEALGNLETELDDAYADLTTLSETALKGDAQAEASMQAKDEAAYAKLAPSLGASIEASYLAAVRVEGLTFGSQSHAYVAEELYLRHPDEVGVVFTPVAARVHGSVLLGKKLCVVATQRLRPLRLAFYAHHPEGRLHATLVGEVVPPFFAKVKLRPVAAGSVHALVHGPVFVPPRLALKAKVTKKLMVRFPEPAWRARIAVKPPAFRAAADWKSAGSVSGKLLVGVKAAIPRVRVFGEVKATPIMSAKLTVRGEPIVSGMRLKMDAAHEASEHVAGGVSGGIERGAKLKGQAQKVGAGVGAEIKGGVSGGLGVKGKIGAGVKVKLPKPPPPPKVKVEGGIKVKAKGGIKIGN